MTDVWKYFECGRAYNNSLVPNQYTMVNTNNEFFNGNQWLNMPDNEAMRRLAKPVFNIIKRVTSLFVASITSSSTTINFEPLSHKDDAEAAAFATELISVDASFKGEDTSDFVSIQVWGKRNQDYYLRYCLNKRLNFPQTVEAIKTVYRLFPRARTVLVEEAANGPAIIQTLQREMFIIPVTPLGGKVARVNAISPAIESGHVYVPDAHQCPWVAGFIDQFTGFPNVKNDDMVDAASQALNRLIYCSGEAFDDRPRRPQPAIRVEDFYDPYGMF